eukprot:Selendium_serpulae@DN2657_c0_g1_i2.p1
MTDIMVASTDAERCLKSQSRKRRQPRQTPAINVKDRDREKEYSSCSSSSGTARPVASETTEHPAHSADASSASPSASPSASSHKRVTSSASTSSGKTSSGKTSSGKAELLAVKSGGGFSDSPLQLRVKRALENHETASSSSASKRRRKKLVDASKDDAAVSSATRLPDDLQGLIDFATADSRLCSSLLAGCHSSSSQPSSSKEQRRSLDSIFKQTNGAVVRAQVRSLSLGQCVRLLVVVLLEQPEFSPESKAKSERLRGRGIWSRELTFRLGADLVPALHADRYRHERLSVAELLSGQAAPRSRQRTTTTTTTATTTTTTTTATTTTATATAESDEEEAGGGVATSGDSVAHTEDDAQTQLEILSRVFEIMRFRMDTNRKLLNLRGKLRLLRDCVATTVTPPDDESMGVGTGTVGTEDDDDSDDETTTAEDDSDGD